MLKKYVAKFTVDILPSVAATVIGAYIVNHYIVSKPAPGAPVASAASTVDPKAVPKADARNADKTPDASAETGNTRGPGVKAKGISERAILEKAAAERPQQKQEKSGEDVADKPAETASIPAETRKHSPAPREKTAARTVPATAPVVSTPSQPAPVQPAAAEAASASEERRDANDLARAAIDRLRSANEASRPQEAARTPDPARVPEAARVPDATRIPEAPRVVLAPAVRTLPPPVMVSTPARETFDSAAAGSQETKPPYAAAARIDDPRRPTPPADIPSPPLDLRAEASGPAEGPGPLARARNTAEDVLSAAKSVFHVVLPK